MPRFPTFSYRSYDQLHADLLAWLPHLPPLSGVAGVPRSGTIVAAMLAELLNVQVVSLERLAQHPPAEGYRPRSYRTPREGQGPILVVDDTCTTGRTLRQVREFVRCGNVLFGAVYVHELGRPHVDLAGFINQAEFHTYGWNLLADRMGPLLAIDLDGILCPDYPHTSEDGDWAEVYDRWIRGSQPLRVPVDKVAAIITGRLEQHRPATETWLAKHGIRYDRLLMHPDCPPLARNHAGHKAHEILQLGDAIVAYIESEPEQARRIARLTNRPVLCLATHEVHNGTAMRPLF
jgi:uncharacterized HAD superfamily protein